MSTSRFGRVQKATALVPLALLSAAWTASIAGVVPTAATAEDQRPASALPDGTDVPTEAIEAPASVSRPGKVAPGIASENTKHVVREATTSGTSGIPSAALAAYQRAETVINNADKSCHLPWQLVAAIGRVESDHGRFGGNKLDDDGVARPGILGIALDGTHKTSVVRDTDAGQYDSDAKWDRAVGPMQFIPSTWSVVGVDADGDGKRNPQDIDDAALATAVYLCSGNDDLGTTQGQRSAVYRYNHSKSYVDLVLSIMQAYQDGDFTSVPNGTTSSQTLVPDNTPAPPAHPHHQQPQHPSDGGGSTGSQPAPSSPQTPQPTEPTEPVQPPSGGDGGNDGGHHGGGGGVPDVPLPTVPTPSIPPVDEGLTRAEARAQCLQQGLTTLDLNALNDCIDDLLG